jgi:Kef-type K+ transport system membrane component KefB
MVMSAARALSSTARVRADVAVAEVPHLRRIVGVGIRRDVVVYFALAVVPGAAAAGLLWWAGAGKAGIVSGTLRSPEPFARLLLTVTVVVGVCLLAGAVSRRAGQPAVLGEIAGGILLGPSVLGAVCPAGARWLLPAWTTDYLSALSQLGVVIFVFLTGVAINTSALRGLGRAALVVSHASISLPLLLGVLMALFAYSSFAPEGVSPAVFALFIGVAMSVTALPVMARILAETGSTNTPVAALAMTSAMLADVTAWCLLALTLALAGRSSASSVVTAPAATGAVAALLVFGVRPILRRLPQQGRVPTQGVTLVLAGLLLTAAVTEWAGVHAVFGAFLYGLVFPSDSALGRAVRARLEGVTGVLLLPLFFAHTGLRTDIGLLGVRAGRWAWLVVILVVACAGKFAGAAGAARLVGMGARDALRLGALMNCRGLTELIVLNIGLSLGMITPELFTMLVLVALASTAMTAPILRRRTAPQRRRRRAFRTDNPVHPEGSQHHDEERQPHRQDAERS